MDAQMKNVPRTPMAGTGWLMGWRLTFGGEDFAWEGADRRRRPLSRSSSC
jgi:hypothetical protein